RGEASGEPRSLTAATHTPAHQRPRVGGYQGISGSTQISSSLLTADAETSTTLSCGPTQPFGDALFMQAYEGKRKKLIWEIERKLAEDGARPIIFYNRFAYCWQPEGGASPGDGRASDAVARQQVKRATGAVDRLGDRLTPLLGTGYSSSS